MQVEGEAEKQNILKKDYHELLRTYTYEHTKQRSFWDAESEDTLKHWYQRENQKSLLIYRYC